MSEQELIDAERVRFEGWWSKVAFSDKHTQYDAQLKGYPHHETQIAWYSWQAAISQQAVQDGYVLVPKEPKRDTLILLRTAYENALDDTRTTESFINAAKAAYGAITAAPSDNKALVESETIGYIGKHPVHGTDLITLEEFGKYSNYREYQEERGWQFYPIYDPTPADTVKQDACLKCGNLNCHSTENDPEPII